MASDLAIEVDNVSKMYRLYDNNRRDRLKQFLVPPMQKALGWPVSQYCREFWALKDVSFNVRRGESVGVVGRNGSGKSTLLQIICGILNHTTGSVATRGRIAALLELGSGFNPEFTGRENVYVNGALLGLRKAEIDRRMADIINFAEINEFLDQPVRNYSSGMVLRLAFSVIAHVDADILVVDEALAVGDLLFSQKCMRFMRDFREKGTIFFVSHDTAAVMSLCDKAIFLRQGVMEGFGAADEVVGQYMTSLHAENQAIDGVPKVDSPRPAPPPGGEVDYRDMRVGMAERGTLRNDVEVFRFSANPRDFGAGGVLVESVRLADTAGIVYSWVVGGEDVVLEIRCKAVRAAINPVIGFAFKDRLGQTLFADNTAMIGCPAIEPGQVVTARFEFRLPLLSPGGFSLDAMVSEVIDGVSVHHHWAHDALVLESHASRQAGGLVGVPMKNIFAEVKE